MRTNQTKSLLAALVTAALFIFNAKTHAASTALSNFMEATVGIFPNELTGSIREEVIYDDNIYRAPKGDERGGWILSTGLTAKWFRTTNRLTYGLEGEIIYDYYLKEGDELSQFVYSLSPVLVGNIGLGTGDLYVNAYSKGEYERLNNVDQRYARSYTNGVQAVWNLLGHERWGLAITGDWAYKYYPDKEFENNTKQTYGASIVPFCQVTGKTRLGLRLGYDKTKYKNNERHDDS
ncbi:MAG TPA: hypothetical protein PKY10_04155, partial [Lentisphaeria bacterium]|nr:hypothetical protein [Lentisphaeria bacterium]